MGGKDVVDVSSFMLFEATGDSEADSELNMAHGMDVAADYDDGKNDGGDGDDNDDDGDGDGDGDDDAESCNCDSLESTGGINDELGEIDDEEEEGVIDQDWTHVDDDRGHSHDDDGRGGGDDDDDDDDDDGEVVMSRQYKKSRVCVDSTMGLMNEMEKSRLFWEACLAS